jgi:hypothetical protein
MKWLALAGLSPRLHRGPTPERFVPDSPLEREGFSNPRSPFLDTHPPTALTLGAAGLANVSWEQICYYARG